MDLYKMKWKMALRRKKVKGFFKLCGYRLRHKFGLEGDDQFYYHLKRMEMISLLKCDPETEYLIEHGLWEEPAGETAEAPREPGLLYLAEDGGGALTLGGTVFSAVEAKEYEDRTRLLMELWEENGGGERKLQITAPHSPGERFDPFAAEGRDFRWDRGDHRLRAVPKVEEETAGEAEPVRMIGELVVRVDRALAEERLSPECLAYACRRGDAWYDWSVPDGAHYTVLAELDPAENEAERLRTELMLDLCCSSYRSRKEERL